MISSPTIAKHDRLAAFFEAFDLEAAMVDPAAPGAAANLVVAGLSGEPQRVVFHARSNALDGRCGEVLAAAVIEFGGARNPLVNALPERFEALLGEVPMLQGVVGAFVAESRDNRCGRQVALNRLCEVIVLLVLRQTLDRGATGPGLLAGLSHGELHRALVAMHDDPARTWRMEDLAEIAGMSRSRFMEQFRDVVGTTPAAYLNGWRLMLAQKQLARGGRVKAVARRVGFGSAAAFSRAYSRAFGHAPVSVRPSAGVASPRDPLIP